MNNNDSVRPLVADFRYCVVRRTAGGALYDLMIENDQTVSFTVYLSIELHRSI